MLGMKSRSPSGGEEAGEGPREDVAEEVRARDALLEPPQDVVHHQVQPVDKGDAEELRELVEMAGRAERPEEVELGLHECKERNGNTRPEERPGDVAEIDLPKAPFPHPGAAPRHEVHDDMAQARDAEPHQGVLPSDRDGGNEESHADGEEIEEDRVQVAQGAAQRDGGDVGLIPDLVRDEMRRLAHADDRVGRLRFRLRR